MIFFLKSKKLSTFCITFICSSDFKSGFPFLASPRSDLKLVWFFNTSLRNILPSLQSLNNFIRF